MVWYAKLGLRLVRVGLLCRAASKVSGDAVSLRHMSVMGVSHRIMAGCLSYSRICNLHIEDMKNGCFRKTFSTIIFMVFLGLLSTMGLRQK
jgi:hypothetical protein